MMPDLTERKQQTERDALALRDAACVLLQAATALRAGDDQGYNSEQDASTRVVEALRLLEQTHPHELMLAGWPIMFRHWCASIAGRYGLKDTTVDPPMPMDLTNLRGPIDVNRVMAWAAANTVLAPSSLHSLRDHLEIIVTLRLHLREGLPL